MSQISAVEFKSIKTNDVTANTVQNFEQKVELKNYVDIEVKNEFANAIIETVYEVEYDEKQKMTNYSFKPNPFLKEIMKVYSVVKMYTANINFPKKKTQDDLMLIYNTSMASGLYDFIVQNNLDAQRFVSFVEEKERAFVKYYIETYDTSELNMNLVRFLTIYENKLMEETRELNLKNDQLEKFNDLIPETQEGLAESVEKITELSSKLDSLPNIDLIKNLKV